MDLVTTMNFPLTFSVKNGLLVNYIFSELNFEYASALTLNEYVKIWCTTCTQLGKNVWFDAHFPPFLPTFCFLEVEKTATPAALQGYRIPV